MRCRRTVVAASCAMTITACGSIDVGRGQRVDSFDAELTALD